MGTKPLPQLAPLANVKSGFNYNSCYPWNCIWKILKNIHVKGQHHRILKHNNFNNIFLKRKYFSFWANEFIIYKILTIHGLGALNHMGRNLWVMKHEISTIVVSENWMRDIIVHVFSLTNTELKYISTTYHSGIVFHVIHLLLGMPMIHSNVCRGHRFRGPCGNTI